MFNQAAQIITPVVETQQAAAEEKTRLQQAQWDKDRASFSAREARNPVQVALDMLRAQLNQTKTCPYAWTFHDDKMAQGFLELKPMFETVGISVEVKTITAANLEEPNHVVLRPVRPSSAKFLLYDKLDYSFLKEITEAWDLPRQQAVVTSFTQQCQERARLYGDSLSVRISVPVDQDFVWQMPRLREELAKANLPYHVEFSDVSTTQVNFILQP